MGIVNMQPDIHDYRAWIALKHPQWIVDLPTPQGIWIARKGQTLLSASSADTLDVSISALENHAS